MTLVWLLSMLSVSCEHLTDSKIKLKLSYPQVKIQNSIINMHCLKCLSLQKLSVTNQAIGMLLLITLQA